MLDFPNAPTLNQLFQNYQWDGQKWSAYSTPNPPQVPALSISTQRGYLFGLGLSIVAQPIVTVAPGFAADSTGAVMINLPAVMNKTTAAWAPGNNAGGLDTGAMAAGVWYHWYLIYNPTTFAVDVVYSATATPASGPSVMPPGYTLFRRIGSTLTATISLWTQFAQMGDEFLWVTPPQDVQDSTLGLTAKLYALSVPIGLQILAKIRGQYLSTGVGNAALITSPDETVQAANTPLGNSSVRNFSTSATNPWGELTVRTNTSAQIRAVCQLAGSTLYVITFGWIDRRGKDQ